MRASRLFHAIVIAGASIGCGARTSLPIRAMDASADGGRDAGFDAGPDAGFDAGRDAGFDAGFDAAICGFGVDYIDCCFASGEDAGPDDPLRCCEGSADGRCEGCRLNFGCIL